MIQNIRIIFIMNHSENVLTILAICLILHLKLVKHLGLISRLLRDKPVGSVHTMEKNIIVFKLYQIWIRVTLDVIFYSFDDKYEHIKNFVENYNNLSSNLSKSEISSIKNIILMCFKEFENEKIEITVDSFISKNVFKKNK